MAEDLVTEPINVIVSRHELMVVLEALQATIVPGLGEDPLGDLSTEQQGLALIVAQRALEARGLINVDQEGTLTIHQMLLDAIGTCVFAPKALMLFHWPTGAEAPIQYYGHVGEESFVAHTRPNNVLHAFSLLPSAQNIIDQVLSVCGIRNVPQTEDLSLSLSRSDFVTIRGLAETGELDEAKSLLLTNGVSDETSATFIHALSDNPQISILQILHQVEDSSVEKRDLTLLQNGEMAWLITATTDDEDGMLQIKPTSRDGVETLLNEWL